MTDLAAIIERELDRLAARLESPAAFEALFWCLWKARTLPARNGHE